MEELKIKEEPEKVKEGKKGKIKIVEIIILGLVFGFVLTVFGFYLWNKNIEGKKEVENLKNQLNELTNQNKGVESESNEEKSGENSQYENWKIYTNLDIGYTLKYPSDWTLSEVNGKSEVTDMITKYITIDTPDKKYFLYFGLKGKNDTFSISNRTGVGAGDEKKLGSVTVLGTPTEIKGLYFNGKLQEIFFGGLGQKDTADGKYVFGSTFSSHGDTYSGDGIDPNLDYIETAKKILETVGTVEKTGTSTEASFKTDCAPVLSENDKATMAGWKTYKNNKYKYRFQYPDDWIIKSEKDDLINISDGENINLDIRSDVMTAIDYMGYKTDSSKDVKIACVDAKKTYLSGDVAIDPEMKDKKLAMVQFNKNKIPHLLMFSYKNIGASLSSDLVEAFEITLRTIEFSK